MWGLGFTQFHPAALPEPARSRRGCLSSATSIPGTRFPVFLRELGGARGAEPAGRDAPGLRVLWPGWKSHELPWSEGKNGLGTPGSGVALGKDPSALVLPSDALC